MFKRILIPVTFETLSQQVWHYGLEFAKATDASVVVTHALTEHDLNSEAQELLESYARNAHEIGVPCQKRLIDGYESSLGDAITQTAAAEDCDLILIGTHALEGFNRLISGSVTEAVVHSTQIPVMVIRNLQEHYTKFEKILVPVDGNDVGDSAQLLAQKLAPALEAKLMCLYVTPDLTPPMSDATGISSLMYDPSEELKLLDEQSQTILAHAKALDHSGAVVLKNVGAMFESIPTRILEIAQSEGVDLIVMGTNARTGIGRLLLGNIAEAVTHHANVPVLLTQPQAQIHQVAAD
jgi:nucleotide-binding universal stress UspA family protein